MANSSFYKSQNFPIRFSEKSFEVRFCAALSGAMMPFNRNPHWIGMTQAEERKTGIDTLIRMGGRLIIFQFKAMNKDGKFRLKKDQWSRLHGVANTYRDSVYYVFPEIMDVKKADRLYCILKHSWLCGAADIGSAFSKKGNKSATLSLNAADKIVEKKRPTIEVKVQTCCSVVGCYCHPRPYAIYRYTDESSIKDLALLRFSDALVEYDLGPLLRDNCTYSGIPLGDSKGGGREEKPLESSGGFEKLLGDGADKNLSPGLFGLFLPSPR